MLSATRPGMRLGPRGAAFAGDSVYAKLQESQKSARENEEAAPAGGAPPRPLGDCHRLGQHLKARKGGEATPLPAQVPVVEGKKNVFL